MIVALALVAYCVALATVGVRMLRAARFVERAPRLGVAAWQALSFSMVASMVLAGVALTVPTVRISANLADVLTACAMALRAQYAAPGGAAAGVTGAVLALALLGRCSYCLAQTLRAALADRIRQRETLAILGRPDLALGVTVVEHDRPAAYCLPGRGRRIVVTSGALATLSSDQLASVLAHEQAHLGERHDLVLAAAEALGDAFPQVKAFTVARREIGRLIEMAADDAACARTDRLTVADALLTLAAQPVLAAALGAGGATSPARIRRLIGGVTPLSRPRAAAGLLGVLLVAALPVMLLSAPAVEAIGLNYCSTQTMGHAATPVGAHSLVS
jgi:Zn-dependent protease with chaperone function